MKSSEGFNEYFLSYKRKVTSIDFTDFGKPLEPFYMSVEENILKSLSLSGFIKEVCTCSTFLI